MHYDVIYNPAAGNGHAKNVAKQVEEILKNRGVSYALYATDSPGNATQLAREAVQRGSETVISIGGDGTISEIVRGLAGTKTALGIVPAGTGNDFIKSIDTPKDVQQATEFILSSAAKPTDVGMINDQPFMNECGTGFDVMVLDYAEKAKKYVKGLLPYLWGIIRTLIHFKSVNMVYSIDDGEQINEEVLVCSAGNGRIIGGGIKICPEAVTDDGLFDIVIVKKISKLKLPLRLVQLLQGKVLQFKETEHCRAKKIFMKCPDMRVNVDGEVIPMEEATVQLLPGHILIHRP
ncbi:MAG: hypothetical protein CW338_05905 [Clostridiales bacterium]|nr:hypothetical protein [Clostridiales bacterium]